MSDWQQHIADHSVDRRQFMDFRESTLPGGVRIIEAYNASGLALTLLPDRGLDIWRATYNGIPLTWISQGSPHRADGPQDWLRQFNGGLLTTCGLTHVGPPEVDPHTGEQRGIHGRYTFQPAYNLHAAAPPDTPTMVLAGEVAQSRLFGEQLHVYRRYQMSLGVPEIQLQDTVVNHGDTPTPLMLLYHCNVGFPLVRAGSKLAVASDVFPRDAAAQAGGTSWPVYEAAAPNYAEQVFFHRVYQQDGEASALLTNGDIGLLMSWRGAEMPYLTQWKNTRQGIYVCGVEPGNCIPEGQNAARDADRLVYLQPGEHRTFQLRLRVLGDPTAITQAQDDIEQARRHGVAPAGCQLNGYTPLT